MLMVFLQNFFLSGIIIGLASILIEQVHAESTGFIYGAFPIGFLYLLILCQYKNKNATAFSLTTTFGAIMFIICSFLSYLLLKYTSIDIIWISTFIIILYCLFIYVTRNYKITT